jgi:hypothetical protein
MEPGFSDLVLPIQVNVTMEMIGRLEDSQEPAECLDPLVWEIGFIVYSPGGSMRHENIQRSPVNKPVHHERWDQVKDMQPHLGL